jgi:uncharacterized membrane protein YhhN
MKVATILKTYIGISVCYLLLILTNNEAIAWFVKPILIPFLIVAVYFSNVFPTKKLLITALVFSWIGDIILLFSEKAAIYFICGLVSFLLSHLVYILVFTKQLKSKNRKTKGLFWTGVTAIIMYLMVMLFLLMPTLGSLKIPVFVYALVISTMLLCAFKGFLIWDKAARWSILIGAIIFVSSDSILAFNKFYQALEMSSFLIMATYLIAQFLIVRGILALNNKI